MFSISLNMDVLRRTHPKSELSLPYPAAFG
jgi:hypothetical protein